MHEAHSAELRFAHLDIQFSAEPDLGNTRIAPTSLEQLIVNLVVNARDALPNGGRVSLEASNVTLDDGRVLARGAELARGDYIKLSVSDDGVGIAPELQDRIFEPLSDVVMPGMTGIDLIAQIRELRPDTAVMYMSGYANTVLREQGLTESGYAMLDKPFTPAVLTRRIRDVLAAAAASDANTTTTPR